MIKLGIRLNLKYLLIYLSFCLVRSIDSILMTKITGLSPSLLLTLIMFLSEFISGLFAYKKDFLGIQAFRKINKKKTLPDSTFKIYLLIFAAALLDFFQFVLSTFFLPKLNEELFTFLDHNVGNMLTIISTAIFCYCLLKFHSCRHQKCSIFVISICLVTIIIEYIVFFRLKYEILLLILMLLSMIAVQIMSSFIDVIDKYLLEYNFINPFQLLMLEGAFGILLTSLYSFKENPFTEFKNVRNNKNYILLVFFLIFYFILSGGVNIYRMIINKLYSPMTWTLTDSIAEPLFLIYYFFDTEDVQKDFIQFIFNVIVSIIVAFSACIYNELLILLLCGMAYDTHYEISQRSEKQESFGAVLPLEEIDSDSDD